MRERGSTTAEYVGIVLVIVMLFLGLLALRSTDLGRRAPVRPIPAILQLIRAPATPVVPTGPVHPDRPRRRGHRRPRSPGPPPVLLPTWIGG